MAMITFFGDVYLADNGADISVDMSDICSANDDVYIYNFEYANYDSDYNHALHKVCLRSYRDIRSIFAKLPIAVDINNNHIFDYGDAGVLSTMRYLDSLNVKYFGVGTNANNHNNPVFIDIGMHKIALLGYYHLSMFRSNQDNNLWQSYFSRDNFIKDVATAHDNGADIIIPSIHWGVEHSPMFTAKQQEAAHFMIDNGADIVIGHHPHCVQPWELYHNRYIFYSLGNFIFDNIYTKSWWLDDSRYECMQCVRWNKWNRESISVSYDIDTKNVIVSMWFQDRYTIKKAKLTNDKVLKKYSKVSFPRIRTIYRKVISTVSSLFCFKGHFFYMKGFSQFIRMFWKLHIRDKGNYPE